jgi:hypothetical protein
MGLPTSPARVRKSRAAFKDDATAKSATRKIYQSSRQQSNHSVSAGQANCSQINLKIHCNEMKLPDVIVEESLRGYYVVVVQLDHRIGQPQPGFLSLR